MWQQWLGTTWQQLALVGISTVGIYAAVIVYVRLSGLRSFAKMTSTDFAMTVAVGSLIGTTATSPSTSLVNGIVAIGLLFGAQLMISLGRQTIGLGRIVDNTPVLLMVGTEFLEDNMRRARVTAADVRAKLRAANVLDLTAVKAVVLETTGDISVLHGPTPLDPRLVQEVRDAARLAQTSVGDAARSSRST